MVASPTATHILATPTHGAMNDVNSGVWFLSFLTGAPTVGLTLPTLPAGWQPDDSPAPFTLTPLRPLRPPQRGFGSIGAAWGTARPSWRGSLAPKWIPFPFDITAWP